MRRTLTILPLAVVLASCGGGGTQYTEQEVAAAVSRVTGCQTSAVLTSGDRVDTYLDAGSTVATNPSGTAGVELLPDGDCEARLTDALTALD